MPPLNIWLDSFTTYTWLNDTQKIEPLEQQQPERQEYHHIPALQTYRKYFITFHIL